MSTTEKEETKMTRAANQNHYQVEKTYFRNNPRFGRTTTLRENGVIVLVLMGIVSKSTIVAQYEGRR